MITQKDIICKTPQEMEDQDFNRIFRRLQEKMQVSIVLEELINL